MAAAQVAAVTVAAAAGNQGYEEEGQPSNSRTVPPRSHPALLCPACMGSKPEYHKPSNPNTATSSIHTHLISCSTTSLGTAPMLS